MNRNINIDNVPVQKIIEIDISMVQVGDTVLHDGVLKTVGRNNVTRGGFCGTTLWGDSYMSGHKKVKLAIIGG